MRNLSVIAGSLLVAGASLALAADQPQRIGQMLLADESGVLESGGRELVDRDLVRTVDHWAILRLDNGNVLRMSSNAATILEAGVSGTVRVRVLSGRVSLVDKRQRVRSAAAGSNLLLRPVRGVSATAEALLAKPDLVEDERGARSDGRRR